MNATLFNGAHGILTHQVGLDVTSNNISNVNTVGFRGNTAEFKSFLSKAQYAMDANSPISNGYNWGTAVAATPTNMKSGSYKSSDGEFHIAYAGKGWFSVGKNKEGSFDVLNPPTSASQTNFFTRNGQFMQDAESYLVNNEGFYLYGINLGKIGEDGVFNSSQDKDADLQALSGSNLTPIKIPKNVYYRPNVTSEMNLAFNLNRTELGTSFTKAFSNIDGVLNFDAIFEQDFDALMDGNSKPIDVRANKYFTVTKYEQTTQEVPNPDFNPNLPEGPDNQPNIQQPTMSARDIRYVYGESITDSDGNTLQGFKTINDLKNLLAAEGIGLDVQRNDAGDGLEGNGLSISNIGTEPIALTLSGSLVEALGLRAENLTLAPQSDDVEQNKINKIFGTPLSVPTYGYSNSIYDEQGNRYSITNSFYLKQASAGAGDSEIWRVRTAITSADGQTFYSDSYTDSELVFQEGKAVAPTSPINVPFLNGTIALNLTGIDEKITTSYAGNSSAFIEEQQNGVQAGILKEVVISEDGFIHLGFSNGKQEPMGRVGIVAFVNDQGLKKVGSNLFELDVRSAGGQTGFVSGPPLLGWDDENAGLKYGSVLHKKIELSNVDMANALTELIVYQRGYSFNAKAFTTGDELIREAIGLKR